MRESHGPLSTLLLTAPLLVVPTLAAIGLPGGGAPDEPAGITLGNGSLGEAGEADGLEGFGDDQFGNDGFAADGFADASGESPAGDAAFGDVRDVAAPAESGPAPEVRWAGGEEPAAGFGDQNPLFPGAVTAAAPARAVSNAAGGAPVASLVPAGPGGAAGTADAAVGSATASVPALSETLKALGAEQLELEPSGAGFYFGCTLSSPAGPGGPTIARRFEAEANSPAAAAVDVLRQVRRFREAADAGPPAADFALANPAR